MNRFRKHYFFVMVLLSFASCTPVLKSLYGVRSPVASPAGLLEKYTVVQDLPHFWLDSAYSDYVVDHFGPDSQDIKNAVQAYAGAVLR